MDIIIQNDGIITPFNIQSSRETGFTLLAETRDSSEEKEHADGDIDFGTWLGNNEFNLHGVIEFESVNDRNVIERGLMKLLNDCRQPKTIAYEHSTHKYNIVRLTGKPEVIRYPRHLEVRAQFKADPFWCGAADKLLTGNGTILNDGSFETPLIIEIRGSATNPSVTIGTDAFTYNGTIPSGQTLVIDTDNGTAKLNGANVLGKLTGPLPYFVQPGNTSVTAGSNVTIKWKDRWL